MDPYETLGVGKDATPGEIKRAYRAKAKAAHPDAGGDAATMNGLARAYELLSSPERRAHYDETGETADPVDEIESAARAQFCAMMADLFLEEEGRNFREFLARARSQIAALHEKQRAELKAKERLVEAARKRIVKAPELDLLGALLDQQEAELAEKRRKIEKAEKIDARSLELYEGYVIRETARPLDPWAAMGITLGQGFGASSTTGGTL